MKAVVNVAAWILAGFFAAWALVTERKEQP